MNLHYSKTLNGLTKVVVKYILNRGTLLCQFHTEVIKYIHS